MKLIFFPKIQHHLFRVGLAATLIIVLHLSTMKIDQPLPGDFSDKFYHSLCFLALALLADYAFPASPFTPGKYIPLFLYGVLIEIIQYFIPYRSFSLADMVADAVGLGLYGLSAVVSALIFRRLKQ